MMRADLTGFGPKATLVAQLMVAAVALSACEGAGLQREASRAGAGLDLSVPVGARAAERDVPAPQVFSETERGLWDGRPSLGGVWVAHPGARDPERVLIRNDQTGTEVVGALFRRERENPGPRFQVSSEAASALGMVAGQPAEITVTALRIERIEPPAAPSPTVAETGAEVADTSDAEAQTVAVAALDEPAPRRGLREMFRRTPTDQVPDTPVAQTVEAESVVSQTPMPQAGVGQPFDMVEITEIEPAPAARRGLRDLIRRQAPDATAVAPDASEITETTLEPAAPVAQMPGAVEMPVAVVATGPGEWTSAPASGRRIQRNMDGAPLMGTAFLADAHEASAPTERRRRAPDDAAAVLTEAATGTGERRRLRDMFRRRGPVEQSGSELIPLPETDTVSTADL